MSTTMIPTQLLLIHQLENTSWTEKSMCGWFPKTKANTDPEEARAGPFLSELSVWFWCWGWLVNLIPLKLLYGFLSVSWFEVERPREMTIPSPQVIFLDASHPTATTFAILLNIPPSQSYSSPSMVPSSSHPPKPKALKC